MARERRPLHGWLILDKPVGMGSTSALSRVKYLLKPEKAGHGGTLDPLASGVLPIALGEATKTVSWMMNAAKTYRFTIHWGEARSTDDAEGDVTAISSVRPSREDILRILPLFQGTITQTPPAFSALRVNGQRAYDLARRGQNVTLTSRNVYLEKLALIDLPDPDHAMFEVVCGKGTYVRSLARDIALKLGTVGHVSDLRRTQVGRFHVDQAITLPTFEQLSEEKRLRCVHPLAALFLPQECVEVSAEEASRLRLGQSIPFTDDRWTPEKPEAVAVHEDIPLGFVQRHGQYVRIKRLFIEASR